MLLLLRLLLMLLCNVYSQFPDKKVIIIY